MTTLLIIYLIGVAVSAATYLYYQFEDWDGIITLQDVIDFFAVSVGSWFIIIALVLSFIAERYHNIVLYRRKPGMRNA